MMKSSCRSIAIQVLWLLLFTSPLFGQDTWPYPIKYLENLILLAKDSLESSWYYLPNDLQVATDPTTNCPKIELRQATYDGSRINGNVDERYSISLFSCRLEKADLSTRQYELVQELKAIELPFCLIELHLEISLPGGAFFGQSYPGQVGAWSQKDLTLSLNPTDGEVLKSALEVGGAVVSVTFRYTTTTNDLNQVLILHEGTLSPALTKGCFELVYHHESIQGRLGEFPVITIVDNLFLDQPDTEIWRREIQIKASGYGTEQYKSVFFEQDSPDGNLQTIFFTEAIDLSTPYRLKVIDYYSDGGIDEREWRTIPHWGMINTTSY